MNKIYWSDLGIEITRKCNMNCGHCMRGPAENIDINIDYVDEILKATAFIGTIHFAGGEPSLNPNAILEILKIIKKYNIPVINFDITINGKIVNDIFIEAIIEWDNYCKNFSFKPHMSNVRLTIDEFHENIPSKNIQKLIAFPFFWIQLDKYGNSPDEKTIDNLGNAKNLIGYKKNTPSIRFPYKIYEYNNNFYIISHFVLTCKGNLIKNSDYEYIDEKSIIFANYNNLIEVLKNQKSIIPISNDFLLNLSI